MSTDKDQSEGQTVALPDEAKVHHLLPPDVEAWDPPSKKIAERRIGGWQTSCRLFERRVFRSAGNSRKFWKRIEEDDPFLPPPVGKRMVQEGHGMYPSERMVRMPEQQRASRPTEDAPIPPQPRRMAPSPSPAYTEEPRPVPQPRSVPRPAPPPRAEPAQRALPPADEVVDRRPPRLPNPGKKKPSGRLSAAPQRPKADVRHRLKDSRTGRSATEIREEKERWREEGSGPPPPPKARSLDDILSLMGDLKASEKLHEQGLLTKSAIAEREELNAPRPTPKPKQQARPQPAPRPKPTPPPERPVNRSPSGRGGSGGGMDDLFGGGPSEGRLRIPRRSKGKATEDDEGFLEASWS